MKLSELLHLIAEHKAPGDVHLQLNENREFHYLFKGVRGTTFSVGFSSGELNIYDSYIAPAEHASYQNTLKAAMDLSLRIIGDLDE